LVLHLIPCQIRSYNSVLYSSKIKTTTTNKLKNLTFLEDTFCNLKPLMIIYPEMIHYMETSRESNLRARKHVCLQFVVVAAYTHFRIPAAKPASAGDHSPPSTACSSPTISCSQSGAEKPLFSASLGTCIVKHHSLSASPLPGSF
jgi:(2Fe-2S) ferredoxin